MGQDGEVWQNEAVSRCPEMCTKKSPDYNSNGDLAHWEDSWHPTAVGADVHFRCFVKAIQTRCQRGGVIDAAQVAALPSPVPKTNGAAKPTGMLQKAVVQE